MRRPDKTFLDGEIVNIFHDIDNGKWNRLTLKPGFLRPAYQYTKAEVGGIDDAVSNV